MASLGSARGSGGGSLDVESPSSVVEPTADAGRLRILMADTGLEALPLESLLSGRELGEAEDSVTGCSNGVDGLEKPPTVLSNSDPRGSAMLDERSMKCQQCNEGRERWLLAAGVKRPSTPTQHHQSKDRRDGPRELWSLFEAPERHFQDTFKDEISPRINQMKATQNRSSATPARTFGCCKGWRFQC
jgi:hypothetical protein